MSDDISGASAKLKPWHFAVIGGACIASVMAIPALSHLMDKKKRVDTTAATMAANSTGGEPWHAPAFPASPPPTPAPVIVAGPPPVPSAPVPDNLVPNAPRTPFAHNSGGIGDYRMFGQNVSVPPAAVAQGTRVNPGQDITLDETPEAASRVAAGGAREGSMGDLLKPTETTGYIASRIKHPWATIEQGRIISCNSVTPMTSQLPGFVKAKITYDVRSTDGTTTLIDRNSDIFGEIGHGLAAGQDRLFVLWRSVTTPAPDFVRITLNSPAADELGEAGLPGDVDTHTWRRIGGALMLSGVETLLQGVGIGLGNALSNGSKSGNNLNFYQFQGQGNSLASSLLQHTISIPDTLHRDQALPCSIFVSGDLDFSSVYSLRRK